MDAAELYDLVARVGARLSEKIRETAQELLPESAGSAGTLMIDEVKALESCSVHTMIVTSSLDPEVLVLTTPGDHEAAGPSVFADVVVENVERHHTYEYFVPTGRDLARRAALLRQQIIERSGMHPAMVDRFLKAHQVSRPCVPGYVVYEVAVADLQSSEKSIYDRVAPFLSTESSRAGMAHVATVEPASRSYRQFGLLDAAVLPSVLAGLDELRKSLVSRDGKLTKEER